MRNLTVILCLSLLLPLAACRGPGGDAGDAGSTTAQGAADDGASPSTIRLELPQEPEVGPAELRVYLLGDDGDGISGAEVEILGTMTHAGMTPVVREPEEVEPGLYVADDFEFTMAGDWIVTAEATLADGRTVDDEATTRVREP